jgi:hypothetical protein
LEILLVGEGEFISLFVLEEELERMGNCREDSAGCSLQF